MSYSDPRTQRLYSRLWARVKNAATAADKHRAIRALRKRFPAQQRLMPEVRKIAARARRRLWAMDHPDRRKKHLQRAALRLKTEVFSHYTQGAPRCQFVHPESHKRCRVVDIDLLQLDHVNGDWSKDLWPNGARISGPNLWRRVRDAGYPLNYQVLCRDHNLQKGPAPYSIRNGTHPIVRTWGFAQGTFAAPALVSDETAFK